jgi:hypothetical protein
MSPCVNHLGKNNTRLTLKQQLMLTSEDQTANAREPEKDFFKNRWMRPLKERACAIVVFYIAFFNTASVLAIVSVATRIRCLPNVLIAKGSTFKSKFTL